MKVRAIRTAMCGGGLSYDVIVPLAEVQNQSNRSYQILRDSMLYLPYVDATCPEDQRRMEQGWPRYRAFLTHEKVAKRQMLKIAMHAFPELKAIRGTTDSLPSLWVNGLSDNETSAELDVDVRFDCASCGGLILDDGCRSCDTAVNASL